MKRITYVRIGDYNYPLSFSLGASKALAKKYGSITKMADKIVGEDVTEETIDTLTFVISLLVAQGCGYMNMFCANEPKPKDARVKDDKWIPITPEELELTVDISDIPDLTSAVFGAIRGSQETELEASSESKNVKAPKVGCYSSTFGAEI